MTISQYSDDELLEEVKHRGFKIKPQWHYKNNELCCEKITIGGITFELRN